MCIDGDQRGQLSPSSDVEMAGTQAPIVDDDDWPLLADSSDGASGVDSALDITEQELSTKSLESSIFAYELENGRMYHAYRRGKYILPNDDDENERLDIQNHHFLLTFDGRACFAPGAETATNVLDVGTGTGIWAMDFADEHPHALVTGVDLSPIQPQFGPQNCHFEIADLEEEWTFSRPFDFVFSRMMVGSIADWDGFVDKAYRNMAPGGWLEVIDCVFPIQSDDGTINNDQNIMKWINLLIEGSNNLGRPLTDARFHRDHLHEAGFVNIEAKLFKWPTNRWPKDKKHKEVGLWTLANIDRGLEGLSMALLTRGCNMQKEEVDDLLADVRKDLRNTRIHAYWPIMVVYGQKPEI